MTLRETVTMTEKNTPHIKVATPAALLAVIPHLLGFTPEDSMVVIGTSTPRDRVKVTMRYDLPDPADAALAAEITAHAAVIFSGQDITAVVAAGYGPARLVTPVAEALRATGLPLRDILRVEGGRYWSYICTNESCCTPEGTAVDVNQPAPAELSTPLADRAALAATVAPVEGEEADAIRSAFATFTEDPPGPAGGVDAIVDAIEGYRTGHWITKPSLVAYLLFQLQQLRVRDMAWAYMDPAFNAQHVKLWTDLTRYAVPGLPAAAPAALLAFVAWQSGNGALSNVALDRALADDPQYSMALLLRQVITAGAPPRLARLPMTPEEVAASYDEADPEAEAGSRVDQS
jgi:Domain of unknown function (DUF4192)